MNIYEKCSVLENDGFIVRLIEESDADDLIEVYGDKYALPFFNSDNCNGSNFYCSKIEYMRSCLKFWLIEYHENRSFVRFSIVGKKENKALGTIEMFKRKSEDNYNGCGLLRLDLRRDYEKAQQICDILSLIITPFYDWFDCPAIATKAAVYAVERIEALNEMKFIKSDEPLIGNNGIAYYDYWVIKK